MFCQLGWMPSSIWRQVAVMISKNSIANTRIDLYQIQCHLLNKNILKQAFKVCSWWQFISFSFCSLFFFYLFSRQHFSLYIFSFVCLKVLSLFPKLARQREKNTFYSGVFCSVLNQLCETHNVHFLCSLHTGTQYTHIYIYKAVLCFTRRLLHHTP